MGLGDTLRNAVRIVDSVTADIQATVQHEAWIGQDGRGKPSYAAAVARACAVSMDQRQVEDFEGRLRIARTRLTFPRDIAPNGATGRIEPIDPRDRITLPDGTTGPILNVKGFVDRATNRPFAITVFLGEAT
jgi:hypothetical protein